MLGLLPLLIHWLEESVTFSIEFPNVWMEIRAHNLFRVGLRVSYSRDSGKRNLSTHTVKQCTESMARKQKSCVWQPEGVLYNLLALLRLYFA
ncbi:hypothetical protein K443DRAFT_294536 [Laccaria amethystina LaAM-08-1]|uniref:Uncharacterized protein n=1 Tax=Laccaria amethystina LaAM-08-1 TaxID=1095629 RepID=A0A0C9X4D0_9AGAR|nr:hypothetical protein K443DRAFT_294536 [Laccaria amethystina LaAM-08-1]